MSRKSDECANMAAALTKLERDSAEVAEAMSGHKARYDAAVLQCQDDKIKLARLCHK